MKSIVHKGLASIVMLLFIVACDRGPKVISQTKNSTSESSTGIFSDEHDHSEHDHSQSSIESQTHKVVVKEVLPTSKYVYMRVVEGDKEFWLATAKREVKVGGTYFFRDGLLKTNFESKEYDRVFDEIYLVSKFVEADHGGRNAAFNERAVKGTINKGGSISIADLVNDPQKYAGKVVQVSGECTKVNPNIMGRNWVHINDGSSKSSDIVVTSGEVVAIGEVVTMRAKVTLNKDFGAGYKYDVILEEGTVLR